MVYLSCLIGLGLHAWPKWPFSLVLHTGADIIIRTIIIEYYHQKEGRRKERKDKRGEF